MAFSPPRRMDGTGTRPNGVKATFTFDWIRLDLGNNRGLTSSFGGTKATGAVPNHVFKAWCETVDGKGKYATGKDRGENILVFADAMGTLWPEWDKAPDTSHLVVGYKGTRDRGPRKGLVGYEVLEVPIRKGGNYIVKFDGDSFRTRIAADMLINP